MVLSSLPLTIFFPSGLHATDLTLKLWEVWTRKNRSRESKTWKKIPIRVPGHWTLANVHFEIFDIQIILEHMFINKNLPFRVVYTHRYSTQQKKMFFLLFSCRVHQKNAHVRVAGQGRLATSRLWVPNLDGVVPTAAGNFLSIGTPRHWVDPEIARSQHTNQHK